MSKNIVSDQTESDTNQPPPGPITASRALDAPLPATAVPAAEGDKESELNLAPQPPQGPAQPVPPPPFTIYHGPPREPFRFSLLELLLLTTFAAMLLSMLRLFGAVLFSAIAGVVVFLGLVALSLLQPSRSILHLGWWVMVTIYLLSAMAAILGAPL